MTTQARKETNAVDTAIGNIRALPIEERLLALYELGIEASAARSAGRVTAVLNELITTLDFGYTDIAEGFYRLYTYCLERSDAGDFDQVGFVLGDLRATLCEAVIDAKRSPGTTVRDAAGA
jgi:hypothetical protein